MNLDNLSASENLIYSMDDFTLSLKSSDTWQCDRFIRAHVGSGCFSPSRWKEKALWTAARSGELVEPMPWHEHK